jgi:hypothetical protein
MTETLGMIETRDAASDVAKPPRRQPPRIAIGAAASPLRPELADWRSDFRRRENSGRHPIKQRLEDVVIAPVAREPFRGDRPKLPASI